ncbi:MAG: IS1096 element passenger TnpR family protein [Sediminibacterium sp.]
MAILKFRVYWEEDDAIYRDILVKHTQTFADFHQIILKAFEFDQKHDATFFRSNDVWVRGREISKEVYAKEYIAPPLMMEETVIGSEIIDTNQHFIFLYDFLKSWTFLIQLIQVIKNVDADMTLEYPIVSRIEGVGPMQYGTKGLLGPKFADIEEKYDLAEAAEGYGEEGEGVGHGAEEETSGMDEEDDSEEDTDDESEDSAAESSGEFFDEEAY